MRTPKMFGIPLGLLLLTLVSATSAQGTFEDAETSNDYTSAITHQQFDLRHTIPGEPEVDYPIYSEVPKTSFECTGKHEGYYADMETRCQAFRICAHTARGTQGFGFLCPNGTLFSQKNFVCDWYRNVNCAESEQYYSKNSANRIGSSLDMMERVRQMMEYPMKTISAALQSKQASHHTLKKQLELSESGVAAGESGDVEPQSSRDSSQRAYLNRKSAVTRAQVESVSKTNVATQQTQVEDTVTQQRKRLQQQRQQQRTDTKTQSSNTQQTTTKTNDEDVYVNSLGELSSDPGVNFEHDSARIIAESPSRTYNYAKKSNFAEKVNVGLNSLAETTAPEVFAPDYVKHLRTADEDAILAANINNLLEVVSEDLDTSVSGYQVPAPQKNKTSFRFLSRGFSSQSDRSKRPPYVYAKPKQTASTIRFTPNELPIDDTYKDTKESIKQKPSTNEGNGATFDSSEESMKFIIMTTTPTPIQPAEIVKDTAAEVAAKVVTDGIETGAGFRSVQEYETTEGPVAITTTEVSTNVNSDRYYLNNVGTMPQNLDYNFLSPPAPESEVDTETSTADEPTLYEFNDFDGGSSPAEEIIDVNATETLSDLAQTETTTVSSTSTLAQDTSGPADVYANIVEKLLFPAQEEATTVGSTITTPAKAQMETSTYAPIVDEEQLDAEHQATKLLLAGVKLTKHSNNEIDESAQKASGSYSAILDPTYGEGGALFIHVDDDDNVADSTTTTTTTTTSTTAQPETSTSVIASLSEGGSFQERIRNYRRFASQQRGNGKPSINVRRNQLPASGKLTTTTTKAPSSSSTTTTRSYLKRVAASRLRLSRLSAANNRLTTAIPSTTADAATVEYTNTNNNSVESSQTSRKIAVRNIDKELGSIGGGKRYDARGNSFDKDSAGKRSTTSSPAVVDESSTSSTSPSWESVRNNLRRFQVSHKPTTVSTTVSTTTVSPRRAAPKATRNNAVRTRNRFSNFKTQTSAATTTTAATTITTTTTTTTAAPTTAQPTPIAPTAYSLSPTPNLDHILKSITSSVSYSTSTSTKDQAPLRIAEPQPSTFGVATNIDAPQTYQIYDLTSPSVSTFASTPPSAYEFPTISSTPSSPITIDTHADDSATFLDFDKLTRAIVDDSVLQNFRTQQQSSRPPTVYQTAPVTVARSLSTNSNARAVGNSVPQSYNKLTPQAPAQLTPPQRPPQLPQIVQQHTTPTSPAPPIIIARAEGQRIAPNSVSTIIRALATQPPPKTTPPVPYVPLDDFLTKKFGQTAPGDTNRSAATKQGLSFNNLQQQQYKSAQSPQQNYYQKAPATTTTQQIQPLYNRAATQDIQSQNQKQQQAAQAAQQQQQQFNQQFQQQQQQQLLQQQQQLQQLKFQQQQQQQFQQQQQKIQQQQLQQQQLKQQQQYAQQQLNEQQYFQKFAKPAITQQQQPQQAVWQQKQQQQQIFSQQSALQLKQNQQYSQQKQTYLQPTQKQTQQQQLAATKNQYNYPQQQQQTIRLSSTPQQPQTQQQRPQQTTQNFFTNFQQQQSQQQQQFTQFPPFTSSAGATQSQQLSFDELSNSIVPPEHDKHLNIQLPALTAGLIPAPTATTFTAQRRMDVVDAAESENSSIFHEPGSSSAYNGVSSYDVPLSSIGRLPNDITHLLRRLRKVK